MQFPALHHAPRVVRLPDIVLPTRDSPRGLHISFVGCSPIIDLEAAIFSGQQLRDGVFAQLVVYVRINQFAVGKDQLAAMSAVREKYLGVVLFAALQLHQIRQTEVSKCSGKRPLCDCPFAEEVAPERGE
jgi:hypothetical protein